MVKKIAIACLCMALGSSLGAKDMSVSDPFIGLEVGYTELQGDIGGYFNQEDYEDSDVSYGFRVGAQSDDWRVMLIFNYYDNDDADQNAEIGYVTFDYFLLGDKSSSSTFDPYIGANIGYLNYESTYIDDNGVLYGGQAGFVINAAEKLDLDFSYRYSLSDASALDHVGSFIFGINYLY